jgi:GT2 family glycosyltransferase
MIDWLRRLFGSSGNGTAAPLSHTLLLVAGTREPRGLGQLRASEAFGHRPNRRVVSICELTPERNGDAPTTIGLATLAGDLATRLAPQERSRLLEFVLATTLPDLEKPESYSLARGLNVMRDQLREQLPPLTFESPSDPAVIDSLVMADERSLWVVGWCIGGEDTLRRLELLSPEGERVGSLDGAYRYPRPDVEEGWSSTGGKSPDNGFIKHLELEAPSLLSDGWICEVRGPSGAGFQMLLPTVIREPVEARQRILSEASADRPRIEDLRHDHALPALTRLQKRIRGSIEVESMEHGEQPADPDVSVVVPLYERIDFLEHQMTHFWQDPEMAGAELIYVLDSPQLRGELVRLAAELHALYGLPFKLLTLNRNAGFATVNNVAAEAARGRLLLLLNSDVLPTAPGWLEQMRSFYDATPKIGALGPKLLYEDDSIQHAGMYFKRDPATRFWWPQHYFKGFSRALAAANVTRPVPAVTGACMMVDRALFREAGGLSDGYIQGGFEDSDFCIRLVETGRENWYLSGVELYHLEAQSFPITFRPANPYNAWLQTHLWDEQIQRMMKEQPEGADTHLVAVG